MKCPECDATRVYDLGGRSTLIAFCPYYENGIYHSHDPNINSNMYRCSNGHMFEIKSYTRCPSCDYGGLIE